MATNANAFLRLLLMLGTCIAASAALAGTEGRPQGWTLERGAALPTYAAVEPTQSTVNIDTVVLACEQAMSGGRVLQLQLYLTDEGVLRPVHPHSSPPKDDPRAEISIDGKVFPVALLFADQYVVLADAQSGPFPMLSKDLLDAMQAGRTMTLRFDLLAESSEPVVFDGEATVDLLAGGRAAVAILRRCAKPGVQLRIVHNFIGY